MAYPPLWSVQYWRFIHCGILSYREVPFTPVISALWVEFFKLLCRYLPCPACAIHCGKHTSVTVAQGLEFNCWQELWDYAVEFHNEVSKRTKRLTYSVEEALTIWEEFVEKTRTDYFLQDHWDVLSWCVHTYARDPNQVTEEEVGSFKRFLEIALHVIPFWQQPVGEDIARDVLLATLREPVTDLSTKEGAERLVNCLFNSVCGAFGVPSRTHEEMTQAFHDRYAGEKYLTYIRTMQIHEEDQKKLLELQARLNEKDHQMSREECGSTEDKWRTTTIILSVLCGLMLFILLAVYLYYFRWLGWRLKWTTRKQSMTGDVIALSPSNLGSPAAG